MNSKNWFVSAGSLFFVWLISMSQVWTNPGVPLTGFVLVFGDVRLDHWMIGPAAIPGRIITFLVIVGIAYSIYRGVKASK